MSNGSGTLLTEEQQAALECLRGAAESVEDAIRERDYWIAACRRCGVAEALTLQAAGII